MANILIVEDEPALERIMTLNLVKRGHAVAEAATVADADALTFSTTAPFDLVILDINLPDQTGWELLRSWKARPSFHIPPVIVATAIRPHADRVREFCPSFILLKPFPIETLLQLIERALLPPPESQGVPADVALES